MIRVFFVYFVLLNIQISLAQVLVSPPTGELIQTVLPGSRVSDLAAIGENIEWFSDLDCPISILPSNSYDAFPIIVETLSNKIIMIYRQGSAHVGNDGVMVMRTSVDEAKTFSDPLIFLSEPNVDIRNASGGITPSGRIVLFFMKYDAVNVKSISQGYIYSDDEGNTWSTYVKIENYSHSFYSPYGQIIEIGNGNIMVPWYGATGTSNFSTYIKTSLDNGKTWRESVLVANSSTIRFGESSFAYLGNNIIIGLIRNSTGGTSFYQVMSTDNGQNWINQGIVNFDATSLVSPFLTTYLDDNGEKNVIAFYANRTNKKMSSVIGKGLELIKGVSGWDIDSKTELGNNSTIDFGYPAVIRPKDKFFFMGIYYKAISKSVANINFFNFTPYYSKIDYPKTGSIPLLKSNFLVDNGVYYASQTINGIRSTDRLAVKVVINSLGVSDYFFKKFNWSINPSSNILTISNNIDLDDIIISNVFGQKILSLKQQGLQSQIDLKSFAKGVYFVSIKINGINKNFKIII